MTLARPVMLTSEQVSTAKPSQFRTAAPQKSTFESAIASPLNTHILSLSVWCCLPQ